MTESLLCVEQLCKAFGAVTASDGLNLNIGHGEIHALIGPNGAGKSTAIHQLSGEMAADSGRILFQGEDITHWPAYRRAQAGIARSYQVTRLFQDMTVRDNIAMAVQAADSHHFRFWTPAATDPMLTDAASAVLHSTDLVDIADVRVSEIAHGQQRQVELAVGLALKPKLLLLDEPMAGMSSSETHEMADRLERLRGHTTLLLVEHDMDVVFRLADRISVLVKGQVICTDTPDNVRNNTAVQMAYLGDGG